MDMCRACMINNQINLHTLNENTEIFNLFNQFTALDIALSDGLPNCLCETCVNKLLDFREFRAKCLNSNTVLKSNLVVIDKKSEIVLNEFLDTKEIFDTLNDLVTNEDNPTPGEALSNDDTKVECDSDEDDAKDTAEDTFFQDSDEDSDEVASRKYVQEQLKLKTKKKKYIFPYKCEQCDRGFRCEERLLDHMRDHKGHRAPGVSLSDKEAAEKSDSDVDDAKGTAEDTSFRDSDDESKMDSDEVASRKYVQEQLQLKKKKKKYTFPYKCERCERGFRYEERLLGHMREHKGHRAAVCEFCNREYTEWSGLQKHINLCHKHEIKYICDFCGKKFIYESALETHKITHSGPRQHICETCGKSFSSLHQLNKHKLAHTDATPFECEACGKKFKSSQRLKTHQYRHTGIKKFVCTTCGKGFTTSPELRQHLIVHSDKKEFKCNLCQQMFRQRSQLSAHRRCHMF